MKLVFASNNKHKLDEVRKIFSDNVAVISLQDVGFLQEIEETGETLKENSALKAQEVWNWIKIQELSATVDGVFADDTGLEIDALGGLPGVRTARWAGEEACDVKNRKKALFELKGIHNRHARFRTVISLIIADRLQQVEGVVDGIIALQEEGDGGFGYDPIFIPEGYDTTFANLPSEVKNSISNRARAICALKEVLQK